MTARRLFLFVVLMSIVLWQPCRAEVDLEVLHSIAVDAVPLDVTLSRDGRWVYVLTDDARLQIYDQKGALKGTVAVPPGSQCIAGGPGDGVLHVMNTADQTVQTVRVNLQHDFTSDQSPTRGPAEAPVTLTLFTDFECFYCARLAPVLEQVHQQYPEDVRIVFKNFPLRSHRFAVHAALAALAAHDQGQFWSFHDRLFQNYNQLDAQKVEAIRQELNLDAERFKARMQDPALQGLIRRDIGEGNAAGVGGTPTVFINGKTYRGARSLEGFRKAIDAVLAQSKVETGN